MSKPSGCSRSRLPRSTEIQEGGDKDRVRKLVERLQTVARNVAKTSGATTFSVSAGFPAGVGVTIEWNVESRMGLK